MEANVQVPGWELHRVRILTPDDQPVTTGSILVAGEHGRVWPDVALGAGEYVLDFGGGKTWSVSLDEVSHPAWPLGGLLGGWTPIAFDGHEPV